MSVSDTRTIDLLGVEEISGVCVLTITDHLEWDDEEHLIILQEKLNTYLAFIESGEIKESYPESKNRRIRIDVVVLHEPDGKGIEFFEAASAIVEGAGFSLRWIRLEE